MLPTARIIITVELILPLFISQPIKFKIEKCEPIPNSSDCIIKLFSKGTGHTFICFNISGSNIPFTISIVFDVVFVTTGALKSK